MDQAPPSGWEGCDYVAHAAQMMNSSSPLPPKTAAKTMMSDAYKDMHARDLYEVEKEQEDQFHKPARAAEIAQRRSSQVQKQSPRQSRS